MSVSKDFNMLGPASVSYVVKEAGAVDLVGLFKFILGRLELLWLLCLSQTFF